jgi:hypothetical protein
MLISLSGGIYTINEMFTITTAYVLWQAPTKEPHILLKQ